MKLVDVAVESVRQQGMPQEPHLVLFSSSTTSLLVAAALRQWKHLATTSASSCHHPTKQLRNTGLGEKEAERLLRQAVTVVTIAALCRSFPDGPAYIHISMYDDPLVTEFGVTQKHPHGGGKDAVMLQALSPYSTYDKDVEDMEILDANDAHNMNACAIQFLSLVLRINGLTSFRQLYNTGSQPTPELDIQQALFSLNYDDAVGDLEMPRDELLLSWIQATGAERWLWRSLDNDDDDSPLPDSDNARATIEEHLGYGVYEEITEACCSTLPCNDLGSGNTAG